MRIKKTVSIILVLVIATTTIASPAYAVMGGTAGPRTVGRDTPLITTAEMQSFCNSLGRQLGVSQYAGRNPDFTPLIQSVKSSQFGAGLSDNQIRRMLQFMNRALNRDNIIGSLFRSDASCTMALQGFQEAGTRTSGRPAGMEALGVEAGGLPASGEDGSKVDTVRLVDDSVSEQCNNMNFELCEVDFAPTSEVSNLGQSGTDITNVMSQASARSASGLSPACECANSIVQASPSKRESVNPLRARLTGLIQDSLNKKFLNNYAQNREDFQFLTAHRREVFGSNEQEQNRNAESLLCNQSADFQAYLNGRCSFISPQELNRRQQELFNNLGSLASPENSPLVTHWDNLEAQIRSMPFPTGVTVPSGHQKFERSVFDQIRNGMIEKEPVVSSLGQFLTNLVNSEDFKSSKLGRERPYETIRDYLKNIQSRPDYENLKTALMNEAGPAFSSEFQIDPVAAFDFILSRATGVHPGLRIAMSENSVFDKIVQRGGNVIEAIDTDRTVLFDQHLKNSCDKIKKDYADALCNDQSKLLDRVNDKQLSEIITAEERNGISIDVAKYIMCNRTLDKSNILDLSISEPKSSLLSRIEGNTEDPFSQTMLKFANQDADVLKYIREVTADSSSRPISSTIVQTQNGYSSSNSGGGSSILDFINEEGTVSNTPRSSSSNVASSSQSSQTSSTSGSTTGASADVAETTSRPEAATFVPTTNYASGAVSEVRSPASVDEGSRTRLADSISTPDNRTQVDDMVSRVDDAQIQELTRLRDEAKRSADKMAELTSRTQLDRIKALEDQIRNMEAQRQAAIAQTPTPQPTAAQRALVPPSEFSVARSTSEIPGREVASVSQAQVGGSGSGGGSVLGNLQSTLAGAMNGNSGQGGLNEVSPLVITSNVVKSTSPDLSQEVLRFLETEPDLSSLTQIKERGLLYRFKVVRDGKEIVEEVLIQFDRLSPEAKSALEAKIARRRGTNPAIDRIETELANVKRTHSYESLRLIIGQQAQRSL